MYKENIYVHKKKTHISTLSQKKLIKEQNQLIQIWKSTLCALFDSPISSPRCRRVCGGHISFFFQISYLQDLVTYMLNENKGLIDLRHEIQSFFLSLYRVSSVDDLGFFVLHCILLLLCPNRQRVQDTRDALMDGTKVIKSRRQ